MPVQIVMKLTNDPRHKKREKLIQKLFSLSFRKKDEKKTRSSLTKIIEKLPEIDKIISQAAPEFPLEKISRIDLSILRLAVFEFLTKTAPQKVIINEAVELAKEFGNENSFSFVNGALGTILKNL